MLYLLGASSLNGHSNDERLKLNAISGHDALRTADEVLNKLRSLQRSVSEWPS
jgi:hypothetical protein